MASILKISCLLDSAAACKILGVGVRVDGRREHRQTHPQVGNGTPRPVALPRATRSLAARTKKVSASAAARECPSQSAERPLQKSDERCVSPTVRHLQPDHLSYQTHSRYLSLKSTRHGVRVRDRSDTVDESVIRQSPCECVQVTGSILQLKRAHRKTHGMITVHNAKICDRIENQHRRPVEGSSLQSPQ